MVRVVVAGKLLLSELRQGHQAALLGHDGAEHVGDDENDSGDTLVLW
jgi:hypothetical protein